MGLHDVCVFDSMRSQNVAIVVRGVFGQMPSVEDMEALAAGIDAVEPSYGGVVACHLKDADRLTLLASALPSESETKALLDVPSNSLRLIERLVRPLAEVPFAAARLRALCLSAQAAGIHDSLLARMQAVSSASKSLRGSKTLRCLLQTIARLGSWINSADPDAERGFTLSSALGKLRQFRALRQDRGMSLLHVALLSAVDGQPSLATTLVNDLTCELGNLTTMVKEDLKDLADSVSSFAADAEWLSAEAERSADATED